MAGVANFALYLAAALQTQPSEAAVEDLNQKAGAYISCLQILVRVGMSSKMDPVIFKEGFAKACLTEEEAFRNSYVKLSVETGKTEAEAMAEVDQNILNGRTIFAKDQEQYVLTGEVPG